MIKVLSVFGTRPEAIKMAPVVRELAQRPDVFTSRVCVTAQHRTMLDQILGLFDITPDYDLDIMRPNQSLADITTAVLRGLDPVLCQEQPDWVLVQGDTTSVMATCLAAYYRRLRVGHVEAGLRTHDKYQPYPEEINRRVASVIADLHFAPTEWAAGNLRREGVPAERIVVTGNTVIDAVQQVAAMPFDPVGTPIAELASTDKRIILVTAHRRESFGAGMVEICAGLRAIAERFDDVQIVYPVHLNPNIQEPVHCALANLPNVSLLPPLDYQPMVWLLRHSYLVITDSGGVQEEAPSFGKPVLVLRATTERPEAIEAGTARLIGANREQMLGETTRLLTDNDAHVEMARIANPYGDGCAAQRLVYALAHTPSLPRLSLSWSPCAHSL